MLGVLVNAGGIILGSLLGWLVKKGIPDRVEKAVMMAIGLCVAFIGIQGAFDSQNTLAMIISMVLGTITGTLIDLDRQMNRLGCWVERNFRPKGDHKESLAEGFVNGTLLFCVGAMAIVGSFNAGVKGDNSMLYTKALLDTVSAAMMTVSMGIGLALSSGSVFVYQGALVLLAQFLQPLLSEAAIAEISGVGSLMILAIGLNLMGITRIKVANFLPALIFAPLLVWLFSVL